MWSKKHHVYGKRLIGVSKDKINYRNRGKNNRLSSYYAWLFKTRSKGERIRIFSNGNVGIGTTPPSYKLSIT